MKIILSIFLLALFSACSKPVVAPTDVAGRRFPQVSGTSLSGETVVIPDKFIGKDTVVLIGFKQNAQFDIDRWILGILQADIPVRIVELPTIAGMMPRAVQSFIDSGMRSGIPKEDWASVVTIYGDASKIIDTFGNERPQNAYAVLLDKEGQIIWTANRGYSAQQVIDLKGMISR